MKIGILTYYRDLNCGTVLQAFATLSAVKTVFPNDCVEIVPFRGFNIAMRPYLSNATLGSLFRNSRRIHEYKLFIKNNLEIRNDRLIRNPTKAIEYIKSLNYDYIYVGADTLLELDRLPKNFDGLSAYWLSNKVLAHKVMLAASAKNVVFDQLSSKQKKEMISSVRDYKALYVRDWATYNLLSEINDVDVHIIPDPTFTLNIDTSYIEAYLSKKRIDLDNVICFHNLRDDEWCPEVAERLKQEGFKIASLRPMPWANIQLDDMSPLEQLGIYRYFKCVITHRFHDTIFCLKNRTPVITYQPSLSYGTNQNESKYSALYKLFNLEDLCLIQDKDSITSDNMLHRIHRVMKEFPPHQIIGERCRELGNEYMNKLRKTKDL